MNSPVLSVIVPVYNGAQYLNCCIDSILNQSFHDFELIIIDDGSTDLTAKICVQYVESDNRVRVFHQSKKGVSCARNRGIKEAKGIWLTFVDVDDYLSQDFFQVPFDQDVDMILQRKKTFGDQIIHEMYQRGLYVGEQARLFLSNHLAGELLRAPWGKFMRASIIRENHLGFSPQYKLGEDALFMLDYLRYSHRIDVVSGADYMYRLAGDFIRKYSMDMMACAAYLHDLRIKYQALGIDNRCYLSLNYTFYTGIIISHHDKQELRCWFQLPDVRWLQENVSSILPLKTKVKYFLSQYL